MKFKVLIISFLLLLLPAGLAYADGHGSKSGTQKIERSIATAPTVAVSLCVDSGDVTVRGWDKNEVLARSSEVGRIELKRADVGNQSGGATKVQVWLADKNEGEEKSGCHAFGDVELMVPRGASLYLQTIAQLDSTIKSDKSRMKPEVQAEYQRNLAFVDRTLAVARTAAKTNPNDPDATEFMFSAYQSKVDLLNTVAEARVIDK